MSHQSFAANVAIILGAVASAGADETAVAFSNSSFTAGGGGLGVYGWQFSTLVDIQIATVGIYDFPILHPYDGFVGEHPVGIWDISDSSQPLVSAIIPAGTAAPLVEGFRYVSINPVTLPAGHDYAIGALYNLDDDTVGALNAYNWQLTMGLGLKFDGRRSIALSSNILTFPQRYTAGQEESFGPNFTYTVVPEPSVFSLWLFGAAAFASSAGILCRPFRAGQSGTNCTPR